MSDLAPFDPKANEELIDAHLTAARNYLEVAEQAFNQVWGNDNDALFSTADNRDRLDDALKLAQSHRSTAKALYDTVPPPKVTLSDWQPLPPTPPEAYVPRMGVLSDGAQVEWNPEPIPVRYVTADEERTPTYADGVKEGFRDGVHQALTRAQEEIYNAGSDHIAKWLDVCRGLGMAKAWPVLGTIAPSPPRAISPELARKLEELRGD